MTENLKKDHLYLGYCRKCIEEKLDWGNSQDWSGQDFELLSEKILEETGTQLSVSTLKRLWGRVKYNNVPNINTLNVLAKFAGYDRWQMLKQDFLSQTPPLVPAPKKANTFPKTVKKKRLFYFLSALGMLSILIFAATRLVDDSEGQIVPLDQFPYQFSFAPVTTGLPNSVIFNYDVSQVPGKEYSLQQSWDPRRRITISPDQHEISTVYYYPGYYKAKLVVDDQILTEKDLYIKSNGWVATIDQESVPRYLSEEELVKDGHLGPSPAISQFQHEQIHEKPALMRFLYFDDFETLHSDNFTLETAIQNTYSAGNGVCQNSTISVRCTKGLFFFNFSIPGCVGDLRQRFNDQRIDGTSAGFLNFGCDFSNWQKIRLEVKNRTAQLYKNDSLIYETTYKEDAGKVVGVTYRFLGTGQIDYLKLQNEKNEMIYEEGF